MKKILVFFLAVSIFSASWARAEESACCGGAGELQQLRSQVESLSEEVGEIKRALVSVLPLLVNADAPGLPPAGAGAMRGAAPEPPKEASVSIDDDPMIGSESAPLVIVEFSDYECPFCARFYGDTLTKIKEDYIETDKLRFVYRDFPLPFHKNGVRAAGAANCAGEQGRYWDMHDAIYDNQADIGELDGIAVQAGLDMGAFGKCMASKKYEDEVYKDIGRVAKIPGFRAGKAPRKLLEKHHHKVATEEVIKTVVSECYQKALEDADLEPVTQPEFGEIKFEEGKPILFEARVEVKPNFKLKDYKGLKLKKKK